ncbi:hypothetical protein WCE14_09140 [Acinetobacter schindleri]|uniref:hypothetical protein n=1 Tax=Acinetobacter schindleri TaxID=108981 RepID=UPI0034D4546E
MEKLENNAVVTQADIWAQAPAEAFHWERLPKNKCVWHCRGTDGRMYSKKAPNLELQQRSIWRDLEQQRQADQANAGIEEQLKVFNIVLV